MFGEPVDQFDRIVVDRDEARLHQRRIGGETTTQRPHGNAQHVSQSRVSDGKELTVNPGESMATDDIVDHGFDDRLRLVVHQEFEERDVRSREPQDLKWRVRAARFARYPKLRCRI